MTDLKVPCQVATGYEALCGMKLHPVAITNIIHLGKGSFASGLVLTCQQDLCWDSFDTHENM